MGTFLDSANGQNEIFSEHFNGTAWSVVPMPPVNSSNINAFSQFNGIKANSPSDVRAVGDSGVTDVPSSQKALIEHFNGTAWSIVPSPSPGSIDVLSGVTTSNASNNVWAVGADTPAGTSVRQTLTLNWNGTSWNVVASPNTVSTDGLGAVATNPGAAIVWAVGESGPPGSFSPLVLRNGQAAAAAPAGRLPGRDLRDRRRRRHKPRWQARRNARGGLRPVADGSTSAV